MKALLLEEYKNLSFTDMPQPEMDELDVLVQIKACGICGSDIHGFDGSSGRRVPPLIMGHEAAGVVADAGSAVTKTCIPIPPPSQTKANPKLHPRSSHTQPDHSQHLRSSAAAQP